jgi:hypothetical protein
MSTETYFLIHHTGAIYRKDVKLDEFTSIWHQLPMNLAQQSNQIIKMTPFGRGYTIKCREMRKQYYSKKQMTMIALQAETI